MKETLSNLKVVFKYGKKYNKHFYIFSIAAFIGVLYS